VAIGGCAFRAGTTGISDGSADIDATTHDGVVPVPCPSDPDLTVCFTFDQSPLPATLANEGRASVSAMLSGVQSITSPEGNAVEVGTGSSIYIPATDQIQNILTTEIWVRFDTLPTSGNRVGFLDNNQQPVLDLFYYDDPSMHVMCEFGNQTLYAPSATLPAGTWLYLACVCDAGTGTIYVDGVEMAQATGCAAGSVMNMGLTIGQNNGGSGPAGDNLVGAIDGLRLWNVARTAAQIASPEW